MVKLFQKLVGLGEAQEKRKSTANEVMLCEENMRCMGCVYVPPETDGITDSRLNGSCGLFLWTDTESAPTGYRYSFFIIHQVGFLMNNE